MRLDKYCKVSRLLKRRTVSKELALNDRIFVNNKAAKPSYEVKVGDIITIIFGEKKLTVRVLSIQDTSKKADAASLYEIVDNN